MDDLIAFVNARLDEDEAAAQAAPGNEWRAFTGDDVAGASVYDEQWVLLYPERYDHDNKLSDKPGATGPAYIERSRDELAAHIARHDPARVLREVAAKRAILDMYQSQDGYDLPEGVHDGRDPDEQMRDEALAGMLGDVVRELAAVWSDHPGYRDAWKPEQ